MDLFSLDAVINLSTGGFTSGLDLAGKAFGAFSDLVGKGIDVAIDFGKDVLSTGLGFDKAMGNVQAVLGQEEGTVENMTRLREFALDQARTSIFTAEETANAYYYMGMAGWKAEQMQAGLPGIMALAAASGEDLARVSDIVTDSITAFGLTADDVDGYVDILAATVTNSNTNVAQLGEAFKYAAPLAGNFGLGVDDIAVSLGLMASAGIKGSQAGTTMRSVLQRLAADTNDARSVMEGLGVKIFDSSGAMRDWGDIVTDARAAMAGLSDEEKSNIAYTVAGKTGMSGFLAIINAAEEDFNKLTEAIRNSSGAAQYMADIRLDNLSGDIDLFNSALDITKNAIYDNVKDPLRSLVQEGTDGLNRITDAIKEDGVIGGLKQLTVELRNLRENETFQEFVSSAGEALGEIITILTTQLGPTLGLTALDLGRKFGSGVFQGIDEEFFSWSSEKLSGLGGNILESFDIIGSLFGKKRSKGKDGSATYGGVEIPVDVILNIDPDQLAQDIQNAAVGKKIEIGEGLSIDAVSAHRLHDDIVAGVFSEEDPYVIPLDLDFQPVSDAIGDAGTTGGRDMANNVQNELNKHKFSVGVTGFINNVVNLFKTNKNASAMSSGRIFDRPTIFGYADGAMQVAGDAGPEAVVGVNSLHTMIDNAVRGAIGSTQTAARNAAPRDMTIILELDHQQFAKAIYRANNEETQRVGVRLGMGGV